MPVQRITSAVALVLASTLGACRQTVVLDRGGGGGDGGGSSDAGGAFGERFDLCQLFPMIRTPDAILALDHSSVMQTPFGNGTRLSVARDDLLGLVTSYQATVLFGYEEFPSSSGCQGGGSGCCAGNVTPPIFNAFTSIESSMRSCDTGGACVSPNRPIDDALARSRELYTGPFRDDSRNRYVVLVTGGEPGCSGDGDPSARCEAARNQAAALNGAGVKTFVVAIGNELGQSDCLDQLALAGGTPLGTSPRYYLARSPNDLSTALSVIGRNIAEEACQLQLNMPVRDPERVALFINGRMIDRDDANGWEVDNGSASKIKLHGAACDLLIGGQLRSVELFSTDCRR